MTRTALINKAKKYFPMWAKRCVKRLPPTIRKLAKPKDLLESSGMCCIIETVLFDFAEYATDKRRK